MKIYYLVVIVIFTDREFKKSTINFIITTFTASRPKIRNGQSSRTKETF